MKRRPSRREEAPPAKRAKRSGDPYSKRRRPYALSKALGIEQKFVDQIVASSSPLATWTGAELDPVGGVNCLGACTQGTGESQRDGSRIVVKSIQIQGYAMRTSVAAAATTTGPNLIQVSLVMDKQTNGTQLNAEDVFGVTDPEVPGRRVLANSSRFKVLKTWLLPLNDVGGFNDAAATGATTGNIVPFQCFIKMNQVVNFVAGAGAGTIADFKDVSFHIIACGRVSVVQDTVTYNSRVRFIG